MKAFYRIQTDSTYSNSCCIVLCKVILNSDSITVINYFSTLMYKY